MKAKTFLSLASSLTLLFLVSSPEPSSAQNGSSSIAPSAPETREELAEPSAGKIRKIHLRALKGFDSEVQKRIDKASNTKGGEAFAVELRSLKGKIQKAAKSQNKEDLFAVIPDMAAIYKKENQQGMPEDDDNFTYVQRAQHTAQFLNVPILKSMAEYLRENNGVLTSEMAAKFATVFLVKGFFFQYDWEEEEIPVGEADVFVANPVAVAERLKASPWQRTQQFIGGDDMTATQYFARFEANGGGMPVLKAKYLANKAAILAKFDEVKNWVIQQERQAKSSK